MKKALVIFISVFIACLGIAVCINKSTVTKDFNIDNKRDQTNVESLYCENENYTLTINNGKYILQNKSNQSTLFGNCTVYKATDDEQTVFKDKNTYYIACYFYEHETSKGKEYFFDKPNGFVVLASKNGKFKSNIDDITKDIDKMFF